MNGVFALSPIGAISTSFSKMHKPWPAASLCVRLCSAPVSCCARTSAEYSRDFKREGARSSDSALESSRRVRQRCSSESRVDIIPLLPETVASSGQQSLDCFFGPARQVRHLACAALFQISPKEN